MKLKTIFLLGCSLLVGALRAQTPITVPLWPDGAPNTNEMTGEKPDGTLHVTSPTLDVYPAARPNGLAIVMCPGGGYHHLAMHHEGHDMAAWFNTQGITYAVLTYRMPNGHREVPLSDAQQALRLMRRRAQEWGIRQVGIMGASAGGHLASTAATHFTDAETRPDFQILFYPVVTMHPGNTHMGSHNNLLGQEATKEAEELFSNERQVTPQTPPAFIMHSTDDKSVPVTNSVDYYLALLANGVSASLHIYPVGGHGWGFRDRFPYKRQWTGELEKWLRETTF